MKLLVILILFVTGLVAILLVVGLLLPPTREGQAQIAIAASPEHVMGVITDVARQPNWRDGIASVQVGDHGWVETTTGGEVITFAWSVREPLKLSLTFHSDAGYRGTWQADLVPEEGGTRVTVAEQATIDNVVKRLVSRLVFDPEAFAKRYLEALKAKAEC